MQNPDYMKPSDTNFAYQRARELHLNFGRAFSQQFIMTRDPSYSFDGFTPTKVGAWNILTAERLPIASATHKGLGIDVAMTGQAVDADGQLVTDKVLRTKLQKLRDPQALADDLNKCAGRYMFVICAKKYERLYIDPSGLMGAVYNTDTGIVAATVHLAIDGQLEPETEYLAADLAYNGAGRFYFGYTPDRNVKRVVCNHYLDLNDFSQKRHWPTEADDFTCPMNEDEIRSRVQRVIDRHRVVMKTMVTNSDPAILPLSGGADSRLLLAFASDCLDDIDLFFTHKTNFNTGRDMEIADELAARSGIDFVKYDLLNQPELVMRRRMAVRMHQMRKLSEGLSDDAPTPRARQISEQYVLPFGGIVMRGNVTDISKAVLWRRIGINEFLRSGGKVHSPEIGVRLLMTGYPDADSNSFFLDSYSDWMHSLPQSAQVRALDFMGTEQFRSHGQGSSFYASTHNFYTSPSSDREIIHLLTSLPPHLRDSFYINDLLIEQSAPELLDVPYTRVIDNEIRENRRPLADLLADSPDVM